MILESIRTRFGGRHCRSWARQQSHNEHEPHPAAADTRLPPVRLRACTPGRDCDDCPNREVTGPTLPLCLVESGQSVRIVYVDHGQRFRKRLADLGLAPGMEVRVVQAAHGTGPMILAVRCDTRLAVGWGMANKIRVRLEG